VIESAASAGRWGQLTYGSLPGDQAGAPAGWRVKETNGGLSDAESELLTSYAITRFESHVPFPGLGQPDEVYEALPRRFGYTHRLGVGVYWHAVQVDADGFGRTGNVFTHALLDRDPSASAPRWHPISLWRSGGFLSPHQYSAVGSSTLSAHVPAPGPVVTRDAILDFLFDPDHWRIGQLAVLADLVCRALAGGPGVVVRMDGQTEAALWIGAVSCLLTLSDARRLGFSLYERGTSDHGADATQALQKDLHIVVVPTADDVSVVEGAIVFAPDGALAPGRLGGVHTLSDGTTFVAGETSELVQMCLFTPEDAAALFDVIDIVARRTGDAPTIDASWALAMSALLLEDEYPDAADVARQIVTQATPSEVRADDELRRLAEQATAQLLSDDPATLWSHLSSISPETYTYELVTGAYLLRACADRGWLTRVAAAPLPAAGTPSNLVAFETAAVAALDAACNTGAVDDPETIIWRLRMVDFVARALSGRGEQARVDVRATEIVATELDAMLDDPALAADVLAACGPLSADAVHRYVLPVLQSREALSTTTVFSAPPRVVRALCGVEMLRTLPVPDVPERTAFDWDVLAMRASDRGTDSSGVVTLSRHYIDRFGSLGALPEDGRALLHPHVAQWTASTLFDVCGDSFADLPDEVLRNIMLRSRSAGELERIGSVLVETRTPADPLLIQANMLNLARIVEDRSLADWEADGGGGYTTTDELIVVRYLAALVSDAEASKGDVVDAVGPALIALATSLAADRAGRAGIKARPELAEALASAVLTVGSSAELLDRSTNYLDVRALDRSPAGREFIICLSALAARTYDESAPRGRLDGSLAALRLSDGRRLIDVVASRGLRTDLHGSSVSEEDIAAALAMTWAGETDFFGGLFRSRARGED
jgi:hypothetical protein